MQPPDPLPHLKGRRLCSWVEGVALTSELPLSLCEQVGDIHLTYLLSPASWGMNLCSQRPRSWPTGLSPS